MATLKGKLLHLKKKAYIEKDCNFVTMIRYYSIMNMYTSF